MSVKNVLISLLVLLLSFTGHAKENIYDCFLFFNELELLEMRLNELYDEVDYFVLVEAKETFRGRPKPLYYRENRDRFKKYSEKIIHVVIDAYLPGPDLWAREAFQRNQILKGLTSCSPGDIILISDVDELIRPSDFHRFLMPVRNREAVAVSATQRFYKMYLNRRRIHDPFCIGTVATTYDFLRKTSPEYMRQNRWHFHLIRDAGWHFTSTGGLETYIQKIENFSHAPTEDTAENKDPTKIRAMISEHFLLEQIDASFPKFIMENQERLLLQGMLDYPGNPVYR